MKYTNAKIRLLRIVSNWHQPQIQGNSGVSLGYDSKYVTQQGSKQTSFESLNRYGWVRLGWVGKLFYLHDFPFNSHCTCNKNYTLSITRNYSNTFGFTDIHIVTQNPLQVKHANNCFTVYRKTGAGLSSNL